MARSSYVYVVSDGLGPLAGFTVKHELVTWLRRNQRPTLTLLVHRLVDGRDGAITHLDVNDLIGDAA